MNAKEYLLQIRKIDLKIHNIQMEIIDIRNRMTGCAAISYEPKEGQSGNSNSKSPQEKFMPKLLDYERELADDIDELIEKKREVMSTITELRDGDEIRILYMRYFRYNKWDYIAKELGYSKRHVMRMHDCALSRINQIM